MADCLEGSVILCCFTFFCFLSSGCHSIYIYIYFFFASHQWLIVYKDLIGLEFKWVQAVHPFSNAYKPSNGYNSARSEVWLPALLVSSSLCGLHFIPLCLLAFFVLPFSVPHLVVLLLDVLLLELQGCTLKKVSI